VSVTSAFVLLLLTLPRQRLLFRVLHAMSLYLPETGYVQGMAALAATLLCYYEEDRAFVMLVRLWLHRGLERLYESGFAGLLDALEDFEKNWLRGGEIAKKLVSLLFLDLSSRPVELFHSLLSIEWPRRSRSARLVELAASGCPLIETLTGRVMHHINSLWHPMVPDAIQLFAPLSSTTTRVGHIHALGRRLLLDFTRLKVQW
jgi:hypothetical protein